MGPFYVTQSNPSHRLADPTQPNWNFKILTQPNPTQPNGTMEQCYYQAQCCSQGQNPKAKDEAKARTLKAEAWILEAKTKARTLGVQ